MFVPRACAAVALAGAAVGLSATMAGAQGEGPGRIVVPGVTRQGSTITVTVDGRDCRGTGKVFDAIIESNAFQRTRLTGLPERTAVAHPRIFDHADLGSHSVSATCGGRTVTGGYFTVTKSAGAGAGGAEADAGRAVPGHGARAGAGGGSDPADTAYTAVGAALVALAVSAAGFRLARWSPAGPRPSVGIPPV